MKKILYLFLFLLLINCNQVNFAKAETDSVYYGKIKNEETYFCSSPNSSSAMFLLPYSYFVYVVSIDGDFYEVNYQDLNGYVRKSDVTLMQGQPNNPYANATFTNYVEYSLYESPTTSSNSVQSFDKNQSFNFYGSISGEEVSNWSDVWYYASITQNGVTYRGYIYSNVTDDLTEININSETFEIVSDDIFTNANNTTNFTELSTGTKVLLIIAITVPTLFILFFLIKPSKTISSKRKQIKKEPRKIHHGDYFEFDEGDL